METQKNEIEKFKECLRQAMIENFKKDGYLTPIVFFYMENQPIISQIPSELLSNQEGKQLLASMIRSFCQQNPVLATGIIIEAYSAEIHSDSEMSKLIENGNLRVSELKIKQDIIMLVFSTPERDELLIHPVDCKNILVGELISNYDGSVSGVFSNFFTKAA